MTAPRTQDDQLARREWAYGCLGALCLAVCALFVFILGAAGGLVAYGLTSWLGTPGWGASIAGGVISSGTMLLTMPLGAGLVFAFDRRRCDRAERFATVVLGTGVVLFRQAGIALSFAAVGAIGGAMVFQSFPPLTGSVLLAVLFPLCGLAAGTLLCQMNVPPLAALFLPKRTHDGQEPD